MFPNNFSINFDYVEEHIKEKVMLVYDEIVEYNLTECVFRKSDLVIYIKDMSGLTIYELEFFLHESWRTIIRIQNLQRLIPELRQMYEMKQLTKPVLYNLATQSVSEQIKYYNMFVDTMHNKTVMLEQHKQTYKKGNATKRYEKISFKEFLAIKEEVIQ